MKILQPTYIAKLPSNKKEVKFRPFVVKEERSLLLAKQEDDPKVIIESMKDLVRACTFGEIEPNDIPYYDFEYLFLSIRSKSVGETVEMIGGCNCNPEAQTPFSVDIESMVIENLDSSTEIVLPDSDYRIKITHPNINYFLESFDTDEAAFSVLAKAIGLVYTKDEVFEFNDSEKAEFIESMNPKQQRVLALALESMPTLKLYGNYKCNKCGKDHKINVSGVKDFFV